ncbi:MurR/RpiR family transcriptional regulator [Desulfovibrio sp. OttesenSCG-928-I05]|nr:MurR/RpiR family transcriptional regulator [Desulfovibrio sp. OttesenSCG-928-I05]
MPKPTLMQRLTQITETTPSEKKLLEIFKRDYPQLAFDNITEISAKAGVGKATVTRFVQRLGYMSFYDFSRTLKEEVVQHIDAPLQRLSRMRREQAQAAEPQDVFTASIDSAISNLQRTRALHSGAHFAKAVDLLADESRPLFLMGAASAEGLINYFSLLLNYFRENVTVLDGNVSTIVHKIVKIPSNAVLLTLSYDRYPKITLNTMQVFHQAGCESILITERRTGPLLAFASVPIVVDAEGPGVFRSRCAAILALEALLVGLTHRSGDKLAGRLESMTKLFGEFDVYLHH